MKINLFLPIILVSPNKVEHWSFRHSRNKKIKKLLSSLEIPDYLPCRVLIKRHSTRFFDDDNFVAACKGVRDAVADRLIPGLAPGRADGDTRITWEYVQVKDKIKGVTVEISKL